MSELKEVNEDTIFKQSDEYSIINNPNYAKCKRIALVKAKIDLLQLTLKDIEDSESQEKLNSLSFIPHDLLPFEISLVDGEKVTIEETDPVITSYNGELKNQEKGDVIYIYPRSEQLSEKLKPPEKIFTCTPDTIETALSSVFEELAVPGNNRNILLSISGTSEILDTRPDPTSEESSCANKKNKFVIKEEIDKDSCLTTSDNISPSVPVSNAEVEIFTQEYDKTINQREHIEPKLIKQEKKIQEKNYSFKENYTSSIFSKIQVLGAVPTGVWKTGSEGSHAVKGIDCSFIQKIGTTTIIIDKELCNPSDFRSVVLNSSQPIPLKKPVAEVRKSARARKPNIRNSFTTWEELKIRLPKYNKKGRPSKGTRVNNQKAIAKKSTHKNKGDKKGS